ERPHAMAAITVICAETDEEAELLASSQDQSFGRSRRRHPGTLAPPIPGYRDPLPGRGRAMPEHLGQVRAVGSQATVLDSIARFVERTRADELIVSGATYDPTARQRSLALTMKAVS